jgi:hypothetical protein
MAETQQRVVIPPEERLTYVVRISQPQLLLQYFESLKSPQLYIEHAEGMGVKLDEWAKELLKNMWMTVAPGTTPLMEVFPILLPKSYLVSAANEITMLAENARALFEKMHMKCLEEEAKLADPVRRNEVDPQVDRTCEALMEYGARQPLILGLYILEFVHRKAQFSLPLQVMPNSVKSKGGIWTD